MAFNFSQYVRLDIPEGRVKQITDGAGNVIWKAGYVNMVRISTTNNGTTIYNGTGYKNGYRIRSGGAEGTQNTSACTGFIPVKGGDIIRISGCDFSTAGGTSNAINVADASFANIGQITPSYANAGYGIFASGTYQSYCYNKAVVKESANVWRWTVPPAASGAAYIRVSGYNASGNHGANMIVTVNEEIT